MQTILNSSGSSDPNRDEIAAMVSRDALSELNIRPDDSWTNTTLEDDICPYASDATVDTLNMQPSADATKWFRLPACLTDFVHLRVITCIFCQMPNFTVLPANLTSITIDRVKGGSWSHADAGFPEDDHPDYFDWSWLSRLPNLERLTISNNNLLGMLPNGFHHDKLLEFVVYETVSPSHSLVGTIPPDWFLNLPALHTFYITRTQLTGTIPNYGMTKMKNLFLPANKLTHWPSIIINSTSGFGAWTSLSSVSLNNNDLVELPSTSSFESMTVLHQIAVDYNPGLTSFPNLLSKATGFGFDLISASNCNISGSLPSFGVNSLSLYASLTPTFNFANNSFSGSIPSSWSTLKFDSISLLGNPGLNGTIASVDSQGTVVSQFFKSAYAVSLDSPGFTGPLFNLTTATIAIVETPNMDFCSKARNTTASQQNVLYPAPSLTQCSLLQSNASLCSWAYPSICMISPLPPTPVFSCPLPSPGPTFQCLSTGWTSVGSVSEPKITLPPSSSTVVNGNLTTSNIVINSVSTTVNVTGCVSSTNGTELSISVTLTQADLDKIVKSGGKLSTLLVLQSASCDSLPDVNLNIDTSGIKSCRTISTDKIDTATGIGATFTVHSSRCNVWWIVLVSVLCGVVVIAVIVVVILLACSETVRHKILPFSKPRAP